MERKRSRRYRYRQKSLGQKIKDFLRQFIAFMFSNVGIIGLVVGYTILGAFVFQAIEGSQDDDTGQRVVRLRNETAARLWQLTLRLNTLSRALWVANVSHEMLLYQEKVVEAIMDGFDGTEHSKVPQQWSFPGAFLYSLTVITTIGESLAPSTAWFALLATHRHHHHR
ncbi:Uncharacterized protein GBIM_10342 [Gryllus bimaculatus]|nr:Uncharacterized protein GBIM_10342 [Gryllus bimaculatus]